MDRSKYIVNNHDENMTTCPKCGVKKSLIKIETRFKTATMMKNISYYCKCCQFEIINKIKYIPQY